MDYGGRVDLIAEEASNAAIIMGIVGMVVFFVVVPLIVWWTRR